MNAGEIRIRWEGEHLVLHAPGMEPEEVKTALGVVLTRQFADKPWHVIRQFMVELEQQARAFAFQSQQEARAGRELTGPELVELAHQHKGEW